MTLTTIDRGGTFTDRVRIHEGGRVTISKHPSDRAVIGQLVDGRLVFGTTVVTNALLERRVEPVTLVVTAGFRDLLAIGDMSRPDLFDADLRWPAPPVARVVETGGRVDANGAELEPVEVPDLPDDGSIIAVALLFANRNPAHERAIAARYAHRTVVMSHEVVAEVGYLARIETTLVDAAVTPVLRRALTNDQIPPGSLAVRSDGGLVESSLLRAQDAVLSGPAGGVLAVEALVKMAGVGRAFGLDMGGTSTDICRVEVGPRLFARADARVAGVRVRRPMLDVETIAAGGGSVLWTDGRALHVGPQSAGADPGPMSRGCGGPPTLTDAALLVGLVDSAAFSPPLQAARVTLPDAPEAFIDVAREQMAAAIRRLAARHGADPSEHALVAYGGAAGAHAAAVAERVGISTVLMHPCASVFSAWGMALAVREESAARPLWRPFPDGLGEAADALAALTRALPPLAETHTTLELRVRGTDHALPVPVAAPLVEAVIRSTFDALHLAHYGFHTEGELELVNAVVRVCEPAPEPAGAPDHDWPVPPEGITGPEVLRTPTTTVFVPEGWRARVQGAILWLEHTDRRPRPAATSRTPHGLALWASRFMAVAEESGEALRRLARSVNVRERLDFSCAVFDEAGQLVANAPHIPVHLGAMGETVRDLLAQVPHPEPGQAWVCNAPDAGGSHLPDLTVTTAVAHGHRRLFVACRAHHVDVGGVTPGSMPPHATRLDEEGLVLRQVPLLQDGRRRLIDLPGCRDPETVRADLGAQIAANALAARRLVALGAPDVVAAWAAHLQDAADEAVVERIRTLPEGQAADVLDGVPLAVALRRRGEHLIVDFTGTGGPHPANKNAPRAVVRAAVLYALRVLVARPIPLNEGALRHVELVIPRGSIVDPPADRAVAGGNVETSQRLVDLVLRAANHMAASQGTMNNLTLGGDGWSLYETVGGGTGASPRGPGADARQVHMTNTRPTDPEVLECRLPLRVRSFSIRRGSGGEGEQRGGDGIVRELEVLAPATAALLASTRDAGPQGLSGGGAGAPGLDSIVKNGVSTSWDGRPVELHPGDRVRVATPGGGGYAQPKTV